MHKKVLITGGNGNLGSWISRFLIFHGYEVFVLSRSKKNRLLNLSVKIIQADITNIKELKEKINFEVDYCIHLASFNEFFLPNYLEKALKVNVLGTKNILEVLSVQNIKNFIYFSTFHVYGLTSGVITEETPTNPKNDYAMTHLFAENYVRQFGSMYNLKYMILRSTNGYGAPSSLDTDKWYLVLNDLVKMAFQKKEIILKGNGKISRDFIWMEDISSIVESLLSMEAQNDTYNLSSAKSIQIIDLARQVQKVYETRYKKKINVSIDASDKNVYQEIVVKNDKLKSILEFTLNDKMLLEINNIFDILEKK